MGDIWREVFEGRHLKGEQLLVSTPSACASAAVVLGQRMRFGWKTSTLGNFTQEHCTNPWELKGLKQAHPWTRAAGRVPHNIEIVLREAPDAHVLILHRIHLDTGQTKVCFVLKISRAHSASGRGLISKQFHLAKPSPTWPAPLQSNPWARQTHSCCECHAR